MKTEKLISKSELIAFNIHENSYCVYAKSFSKLYRKCLNCQEKVFEKCLNGPFSGTCYAGVFEYIYPITAENCVVGFISISGYKDENFDSYIASAAKKYSLPYEIFKRNSRTLKSDITQPKYVDTLISPLVRMLELAHEKYKDDISDESVMGKIILYVNQNYAEDLTIEKIAEFFSVSRSYISHNFKKATGKPFREYLTWLKLNSAKRMLLNTNLNVTEISLSLGFNNSNYFSGLFKKKFGISPLKYRKLNL